MLQFIVKLQEAELVDTESSVSLAGETGSDGEGKMENIRNATTVTVQMCPEAETYLEL